MIMYKTEQMHYSFASSKYRMMTGGGCDGGDSRAHVPEQVGVVKSGELGIV